MKFIDEKIEQYCVEKSSTPSSNCDEIQKYTLEKEHWAQMLTGKMEASFIGFLIRSHSVKRVLEFGTFTGYSALAMAESLPQSGEVVTLDKDPRVQEVAKSFWKKSPHGNKITPLLGEAQDLLSNIKGSFDLIFIDADKVNYLNYLKYSLEKLSKGGIILIDNVLWSGKVIGDDQSKSTQAIREVNDYIQSSKNLYSTLLPIRDGIFLVQKI